MKIKERCVLHFKSIELKTNSLNTCSERSKNKISIEPFQTSSSSLNQRQKTTPILTIDSQD